MLIDHCRPRKDTIVAGNPTKLERERESLPHTPTFMTGVVSADGNEEVSCASPSRSQLSSLSLAARLYAHHCTGPMVWTAIGVMCMTTCSIISSHTNPMVAGCLFYLQFVVTFRKTFPILKRAWRVRHILPPGQAQREVTRLSQEQQHECTQGLVLSMLLRGFTFSFTGSSGEPLHPFHHPTVSAASADGIGTAAESFSPLMIVTCFLTGYLTLLFKVFLWTLAYDFFYYCLHRGLHLSQPLFSMIHAKHHSLVTPTAKATLYHTVSEQILEILTPTLAVQILAGGMGPPFSFCHLTCAELAFAYTNIQVLEVLGHSGYDWPGSSFVYLPVLPQLMGIDLRVVDHDAHHRDRVVNFSKQFTAWDRVFGTYQSGHKGGTKLG